MTIGAFWRAVLVAGGGLLSVRATVRAQPGKALGTSFCSNASTHGPVGVHDCALIDDVLAAVTEVFTGITD